MPAMLYRGNGTGARRLRPDNYVAFRVVQLRQGLFRSRRREGLAVPPFMGLSKYLPLYAIPTPVGSPCPREPVATSTQGSAGVGCPSMRLPNLRSVSISSSEIAPAAL